MNDGMLKPGTPDGCGRDFRRRLALGTALATSAFLSGYSGYVRRAYADCTGTGGTYTCSGIMTTTQELDGAPLTVTTGSGFSIDTTGAGSGGNAFTLTGTGGLAFADENTSTITGTQDGIFAHNYGSGTLSITTSGTTRGTNGVGIGAINNSGTTGLAIAALNAYGGLHGIAALNDGTGALAITATGMVTGGTDFHGIYAHNYGTDLTINANDVSGGTGIYAKNDGTGRLSITATGTVAGTGRYGIYARTYGKDLTIKAADVSGGDKGIEAFHFGSGALSITATGTVTGSGSIGIRADARGTDLTIVAADVSSGTEGIYARNEGIGALSITATGTVTGLGTYGISAKASSNTTGLTINAADVNGGNIGINGINFGTGALTITSTGTVTGSSKAGINAVNNGTDLKINAVNVSSGSFGIIASNSGSGALSITAFGTVTGSGGIGINAGNNGTDLEINAVNVGGENFGIFASNSGSGVLSITTSGTVTGKSGTGIYAYAGNNITGDLTIDVADVIGGFRGINASNDGSGALAITATGTVEGLSGAGIYARNGVTGTNLMIEAADVSGEINGIDAVNNGVGALSIAATGAVTGGTSHHGIDARNYGTDLTIEVDDINGGISGIFARNDGGDLTIASADVSGGYRGIDATNDGSGALAITATGTVEGLSGAGIYARNGVTGTNLTIAAADVSGEINGIDAVNNGVGALSIAATGAVTGGTSHHGIDARNYGTDLTIEVDDINGGISGIFARNDGGGLTIEADDVSGGQRGIDAINDGSGTLAITATGTVTGTNDAGIYAKDAGAGLTIEVADVSGGSFGIFAGTNGAGSVSIIATGTVTGAGTGLTGDGIYAGAGSNSTGLTITATNVSGGTNGIAAENQGSGALSITTSGTVTGNDITGIYAFNNSAAADSITTVTVEDGSAVSGGMAGVGLLSTTGRAAKLANAGSITGSRGIVAYGGPATISNTGTITGTGGPAIDLTGASGPSTVNQQGGTITGAILLSAAADTVNIIGGAIAGDIVGQGSADLNFILGNSGSFTFAAPFTVTGMANVAMNSGMVAIAGTVDTDALTVNGGAMTVGGAINTKAFNLNGGTLSVSSDANLGSGAGVLNFDGGTLENTAAFTTVRTVTLNAGGGTFRTDAALALTGTISGTGGLTKTGAGTLTLNGINTFTGPTAIENGTLIVGDDSHANASLASLVTVMDGGTVGGIGTIGGLDLHDGATVTPGNSIGTLTVAGDVAFAAGSTYQVEVDPEGTASDLIHAGGTATLNGGSVVHIGETGTYAPNSTYTILTADGGVTGTFADVTSNFAFLDPTLDYDASNVYLELTRNDIAFCMAGMTANQCATGTGAESTGSGSPIYNAIAGLSADEARAAFDMLSGEIHASARSALIEDSHFIRGAVNERIRAAFGDGTGTAMPVLAYGSGGPRAASADSPGMVAWGHAFGAWDSFDGNGNAASMDTSTGGFLTGIDAPLSPDWRLGLVAGYSRTSFHIDGRGSSGSSDNYHLGLYTGGQWNALRLTGGLAYAWHTIETNRSVAFPGFSDRLDSDYDAGTFQVFGEAGYRIDTGALTFEPFANLAYVNLHTDGFTEKGGAAALHVRGETTETTFTTLGVHLSSALALGGMKATAHGTLGWRHAFDNTTPFSTQSFAGGDAFTIAGVPIAEDAAVIEAGFDLDLTEKATLGLAYQGQLASDARQHGFKADLSVRF